MFTVVGLMEEISGETIISTMPSAVMNGVSPHYFETVGTRLLRGRVFTDGDTLSSPRVFVINEAMACGLPVVVTDRCGSIGDIVQENDNAFIYPAGDAAALARHLDVLGSDDALRARMGERSREIIGDWSFARGVEGVNAMLRWVRSR